RTGPTRGSPGGASGAPADCRAARRRLHGERRRSVDQMEAALAAKLSSTFAVNQSPASPAKLSTSLGAERQRSELPRRSLHPFAPFFAVLDPTEDEENAEDREDRRQEPNSDPDPAEDDDSEDAEEEH